MRLGICLLSLSSLFAQSTGAIQGTIRDASGSVIPNAAIGARNEATGEQRSVTTDEAGNYQFASLTLGKYRLEVKANGMQAVSVTNLTVEVGRIVQQDFSLKPVQDDARLWC